MVSDSVQSSGGSVDITAELLFRKSKASIASVQLIWQSGFTHGGGTPTFVDCGILNRLHIDLVLSLFNLCCSR